MWCPHTEVLFRLQAPLPLNASVKLGLSLRVNPRQQARFVLQFVLRSFSINRLLISIGCVFVSGFRPFVETTRLGADQYKDKRLGKNLDQNVKRRPIVPKIR